MPKNIVPLIRMSQGESSTEVGIDQQICCKHKGAQKSKYLEEIATRNSKENPRVSKKNRFFASK
jgi:hypothetical protein